MPRPICLRLFWHCKRAAAARTFCTAGTSKAIKMAMIAITTSNSIRVKPARCRRCTGIMKNSFGWSINVRSFVCSMGEMECRQNVGPRADVDNGQSRSLGIHEFERQEILHVVSPALGLGPHDADAILADRRTVVGLVGRQFKTSIFLNAPARRWFRRRVRDIDSFGMHGVKKHNCTGRGFTLVEDPAL